MILTLGISVLLAVLAVTPLVIQYAIKKGRVDQPSIRKVHSAPTPRIGGHVFVPIVTAAWLIAVPEIDQEILSLLAAIAIIYTLGIIDDFKDLSHRIKLPFQFLASGIVIYFWDLVPLDMGGPFGIHEIHGWWGWILMLFFFQFTINAVNYTDGVNGLLGGYTLITFSFITLWAHFEDVTRIWPLTFLLAAGVLGFLYYNFRREAKTFMGDGGSTVIGLIASIVTARMIQVNPHVELSIGQAEQTIPAFFVFVLLFWYPLMDSLQVYTRRILRGNSPFKADRGHFHHYLMAQTSKNHLLSASIILLTTALLSLGLFVSL